MPVSASRRGLVLMSSEKELKMVRTPEDVANAAERLALKNAKIFLKNNPNATKQEIFQRAFLMGMTAAVEMMTWAKEKQK